MTNRSTIGYRLAALGVAWVLITLGIDIGLHVLGREEMPRHLMYLSLTVGAVLGWWGFFWALPGRAKDGGEFLLSARERLVRAGRRQSDPVIVVPEAAPVSDGVGAPAAPAQPVAPVPDLQKIPAPEKGP